MDHSVYLECDVRKADMTTYHDLSVSMHYLRVSIFKMNGKARPSPIMVGLITSVTLVNPLIVNLFIKFLISPTAAWCGGLDLSKV